MPSAKKTDFPNTNSINYHKKHAIKIKTLRSKTIDLDLYSFISTSMNYEGRSNMNATLLSSVAYPGILLYARAYKAK